MQEWLKQTEGHLSLIYFFGLVIAGGGQLQSHAGGPFLSRWDVPTSPCSRGVQHSGIEARLKVDIETRACGAQNPE